MYEWANDLVFLSFLRAFCSLSAPSSLVPLYYHISILTAKEQLRKLLG